MDVSAVSDCKSGIERNVNSGREASGRGALVWSRRGLIAADPTDYTFVSIRDLMSRGLPIQQSSVSVYNNKESKQLPDWVSRLSQECSRM